jgi:glycerol-3-phosphate dehydrogenase (NAD(P)+)
VTVAPPSSPPDSSGESTGDRPSGERLDIAVIGAGSFGTCLAKLLSDGGHRVTIWCRDPELAATIERSRENSEYLPGHLLAASVQVTTDVGAAVAGKQIVLGVTPSHAIRQVLGPVAARLDPDTVVVNASKGFEEGTLETVEQIYRDVLPPRIAARATYLSGPTFAVEIAAGLPSAIVLASRDPETAASVQHAISTERFRVYTSDDVTGVLVGGALKNVVAIAAGVADGLGYGSNTRAALITRGLAEITRMGLAMGAHAMTFSGLSGIGDLVLTCSGDQSRNRRVGLALGHGRKLAEIIADSRMVAEGVKTTRVANQLAAKLNVSAPITSFMYEVLYEDRPAKDAIASLMTRALKSERG